MKYCETCGKELADDAVVCTGCGVAVPEKTANAASAPSSSLSIVSIVLGAIGIPFAWLIALFGYALGGASLACGITAAKRQKGDAKAKVGIVLGIATLVCSLINSILGVIMMLGLMGSM